MFGSGPRSSRRKAVPAALTALVVMIAGTATSFAASGVGECLLGAPAVNCIQRVNGQLVGPWAQATAVVQAPRETAGAPVAPNQANQGKNDRRNTGSAKPSTGATTTAGTQAANTETVYFTGYGWGDNDPPGSGEIAYPKLHDTAGGTGTYADPITAAVGDGAWEPGTIFYVPHVQRYFIVEDLCASCSGAWIDLWVGGDGDTGAEADCQSSLTGDYPVEVNPPEGRTVSPGEIMATGCQSFA